VGYHSSCPCSTGNSQFLSFLSPTFELVPFPHIRHVVFFHFRSSLSSLWLPKGMAALHLRLAALHLRYGNLLLISTDQAHKSRLEMSDFLILTPKIFTRNEQLVKVTSPLQVPSKHPSHRHSDLILDFKSVITIELCYGSARQVDANLRCHSSPLFGVGYTKEESIKYLK
jgi:hypothetical protein